MRDLLSEMFKYQIHKLSKGGREAQAVLLEDILTSDVFGLMSYFPYDLLLQPFLEQVKLNNPHANFSVPSEEPLEVSFWKNIGWPESLPNLSRDSIEPDVLLKWNDMILMVEAKFISRTDLEELLREFLISAAEVQPRQKFFLLLMDKNLSPPSVPYPKDSTKITVPDYIKYRIQELNLAETFSSETVSSSLLWINWQSFYVLVEKLLQNQMSDRMIEVGQMGKRILGDLLLILERKGLIPFEAFSLEDFSERQIDATSLDEVGLMMRTSLSDLSDISVDLNSIGNIGLKLNDPVSFLSRFRLNVDTLNPLLTIEK